MSSSDAITDHYPTQNCFEVQNENNVFTQPFCYKQNATRSIFFKQSLTDLNSEFYGF